MDWETPPLGFSSLLLLKGEKKEKGSQLVSKLNKDEDKHYPTNPEVELRKLFQNASD